MLNITIHGTNSDTSADVARARAAAMAVFAAAGCTPAQAKDEYRAQVIDQARGNEAAFSGLALVWEAACSAAELAASEGWHNPNGCEVTMDAW